MLLEVLVKFAQRVERPGENALELFLIVRDSSSERDEGGSHEEDEVEVLPPEFRWTAPGPPSARAYKCQGKISEAKEWS